MTTRERNYRKHPHTASFLQTFHTAKSEAQRMAERQEAQVTEPTEAEAIEFVKTGKLASMALAPERENRCLQCRRKPCICVVVEIRGWKVLTGPALVTAPQAKWMIDIIHRPAFTDSQREGLQTRLEQGMAKSAGSEFITRHKNSPTAAQAAPMAEAIAPMASTATVVRSFTQPEERLTEDGIYVDPATGRIFKVQFNRAQGGGQRLYAKQLMISFHRDGDWEGHTEGLLNLDFTGVHLQENGKPVVENSWEYVRGLVYRIKPEWRLTPEQAIGWGALYGSCVRCHRDLTKESSIRQMMGDTCASKQGF